MIDDTPVNKMEVKYMYDQLPNKLKLLDIFCKWKSVMRNGSNTKLPFTAQGKPASSTDRRCFTDFETVCANLDGYDGIGIGIFDDLVAIDIDHCVNDGAMTRPSITSTTTNWGWRCMWLVIPTSSSR